MARPIAAVDEYRWGAPHPTHKSAGTQVSAFFIYELCVIIFQMKEDKLWSKFSFLDESGSLNNKNEAYFTMGMLKMSQPYYLQSKILYQRSLNNFHDEMKFNKLSSKNKKFIKIVIDALFETRSIDFYSYTTLKTSKYFIDNFLENEWDAYEDICLKLLGAAVSEQELLILIADHITTPKEVKFEVTVKSKFNKEKKRLALAGVCRFDSKSNDLLQIADLIIGIVSYDIKYSKGLVEGSKHKIEIVNYFKEKLGVETLTRGYRGKKFNIFVEQGINNEVKDKNEKGTSS